MSPKSYSFFFYNWFLIILPVTLSSSIITLTVSSPSSQTHNQPPPTTHKTPTTTHPSHPKDHPNPDLIWCSHPHQQRPPPKTQPQSIATESTHITYSKTPLPTESKWHTETPWPKNHDHPQPDPPKPRKRRENGPRFTTTEIRRPRSTTITIHRWERENRWKEEKTKRWTLNKEEREKKRERDKRTE